MKLYGDALRMRPGRVGHLQVKTAHSQCAHPTKTSLWHDLQPHPSVCKLFYFRLQHSGPSATRTGQPEHGPNGLGV